MKLMLQMNPDHGEALYHFKLGEMRKRKMVTGGDAEKLGIGAMTDARWKDTFETHEQCGSLSEDPRLHEGLHFEIHWRLSESRLPRTRTTHGARMRTLATLIDIAPFLNGGEAERRAVAKAFGRAFETTGFATVVGHGVDDALVRGVYAAAADFFALRSMKNSPARRPRRPRDAVICRSASRAWRRRSPARRRRISAKRWCSARCAGSARARFRLRTSGRKIRQISPRWFQLITTRSSI